MKHILLTKGASAIVDDEDYEKLKDFNWSASQGGNYMYAVRQAKNKKVWMHRLIMDCPEDMVVDHINGNGCDNRRANLRICTRRDNGHNLRRSVNNTSGYKGVAFRKGTNKRYAKNPWLAYITVNKRRVGLGCYPTKQLAALAYNEAAIKYFGDFAKLNVVTEEQDSEKTG